MTQEYTPKAAWVAASFAALFMLLNFADKIVIGMTAVPIMEEFNLTPSEFGLVAGSFFWLFPLSGILGGFIGNRTRTKPLLVIMAFGWTMVQFPIIFGSSVFLLVVSRVLLGLFEGPAWAIAIHSTYKWFPNDKRVLPTAVINQGTVVSFLLAGMLMPLVNKHLGWRFNFAILAALTLIWGLLWLAIGKEGPISESRDAAQIKPNVKQARVSYLKLLSDRTIVSITMIQFFGYSMLALVFSWLPAYIEKGLGYDDVAAGWLFSLIILISVPITMLLSWWSQSLVKNGASSRGARGLFASALAIVGGVLICCALTIPGVPALGKVVVFAIGFTPALFIFQVSPAMISEVAPDAQRAAVLAIYQAVASISGVIAPAVMGGFVESAQAAGVAQLGYEKGFVIVAACIIATGVIGLRWANPERSVQKLAFNP